MEDFDSATFRRALGAFATGVTVVTAGSVDGPVGLTANSFTSVSLDPPLVLFCLDRSARSLSTLVGAAGFAVHVLGADARDLSDLFATRDADKFAGIPWREGITGAPLLDGHLARLECRRVAVHPAGDHVIIVGEVIGLEVDTERRPALGFLRGRYTIIE